MLEELIFEIIKAVIIGLWGIVWIEMIVAPGEILSIIPRTYIRLFSRIDNSGWSYVFAKPLFECATCHSGWVAILFRALSSEFFSYYTFVAVVVSMITAFFVSKYVNR